MATIGREIERAASLLHHNELVAIPTETVYGLAGNALSTEAILKIYKVKNRPHFNPLIAHTYNVENVLKWVENMPPPALKLAEKFWPGPLTLLLPKSKEIPDLLTSGHSTVAFRIPDHPLTLQLLKSLSFPLAAPSANPFGFVSPVTAAHVAQQLGAHIPYILEGGGCSVGIESTIVGFENQSPVLYRLGGISLEALQDEVGRVAIAQNQVTNPQAPGMLPSHYSPLKKLVLGNIEALYEQYKGSCKIGFLLFKDSFRSEQPTFVLSPKGDLDEAAQNLFSTLRKLASADIDLIISEMCPNVGIGRAINDRLRRASFH